MFSKSLTPLSQNQIKSYLSQLNLPAPSSRKGDNGKLLIIGGSNLFHAASRWSLEIASKLVDMVFYSSVPSNNQLIKEAKQDFWNGIVVSRQDLESYLEEADCILIGPGMERQQLDPSYHLQSREFYIDNQPSKKDWNNNTQKISNYLLAKYQTKKWVIDAGALQMIDPLLLNSNCIVTPHHRELEILINNANHQNNDVDKSSLESLEAISKKLGNCSILLKGQVDQVVHQGGSYFIGGGNAGMTKGGTGDVLAGLLAGLYTVNDILPSMIAASYINKAAGDWLHQEVGPFYNATDLVEAIPRVLWRSLTN
ncbi:MAG: YjeF-like carbohydrate kinase [Microgenomates bacterium 39_7]|nr:MAG: YjeF-like carbohydrate kinase [Microgenomates bacterium 39_7]